MTVGDLDDLAERIRVVLPRGWFPTAAEKQTPVLDAILLAFAAPWSILYSLVQYIKLQTRISTSTGNFVEFFARDFFGDDLPRNDGEKDADYAKRIEEYFFTKRNTRTAFDDAYTKGSILEPWNAQDCATYSHSSYDASSRYGSRSAPATVFVIGNNALNLSADLNKLKSCGVKIFTLNDSEN